LRIYNGKNLLFSYLLINNKSYLFFYPKNRLNVSLHFV